MVERHEFEHWMGVLREDIKGVHVRLDTLNGRTRTAENNIVRIEAVMAERDRLAGTDKLARGGGLLGSLLAGASLVWSYFR